MNNGCYWDEEVQKYFIRDDSEAFVKVYKGIRHPEPRLWIKRCAMIKAKKCLNGMLAINPPVPVDGNCIHFVAFYLPDPHVINSMMMRGAVADINTKDFVHDIVATPLQLTLEALTSPLYLKTLKSWSPGDSIFKLIILLCHSHLVAFFFLSFCSLHFTTTTNTTVFCIRQFLCLLLL